MVVTRVIVLHPYTKSEVRIVAVITKPCNCIWKMLKKMTEKRLIIQLFTNILDTVLLNYCDDC